MNKTTSLNQFELMVTFMELHSDLAKGYVNKASAREKSKKLWNELEIQLNSLGPVTRDAEGWKKVWADYKQNIKKKEKKIKKNAISTGSEINKEIKLTNTEKRVHDLLKLNDDLYGSKQTKKVGLNFVLKDVEQSLEEVLHEDDTSTEDILLHCIKDEFPINDNTSEPANNQIDMQKQFYEKMLMSQNEIISVNKDILKSTNDLLQLKKEKLEKTEIYRQEKIKIQYEKLLQKKNYYSSKLAIEEEKLKIKSTMKKY